MHCQYADFHDRFDGVTRESPVNLPAARHARRTCERRPKGAYATGNTSHPVVSSPQLGCCNVAPRRPHARHRAFRRSTSDDASIPHLIAYGTSATATRWPQTSQRSPTRQNGGGAFSSVQRDSGRVLCHPFCHCAEATPMSPRPPLGFLRPAQPCQPPRDGGRLGVFDALWLGAVGASRP